MFIIKNAQLPNFLFIAFYISDIYIYVYIHIKSNTQVNSAQQDCFENKTDAI